MSAGSSAEGKVYRVACIGAARMGSWFDDIQRERAQRDGGRSLEWVPGAVASVCQAIARVELVAVCDLDPELVQRLRERWDIPAGYTDYREMIERERPDIVAIVTSWGSTHGEIAAAVAETGLVRGIYCEKPIGASMAQARADRRGLPGTGWCSTPAPTSSAGTPATAWRSAGSRRGPSGRCGPSPAAPWAPCCTPGRTRWTPCSDWPATPSRSGPWAWWRRRPGVPQARLAGAGPAGGGYVRLRNGVDLLMDGRSPGPRVFQVSGTAGKMVLWNDVRQVQLWQAVPGAGRPDLAPGPLETPAPAPQLRRDADGGADRRAGRAGPTGCDEVRAARALEVVLGLHLSHQRNGERVPFPLGEPHARGRYQVGG